MFLVRLPVASFVFLISAGGYLTISWTIELIILVATLIPLYSDIYIISFHHHSRQRCFGSAEGWSSWPLNSDVSEQFNPQVIDTNVS